MWQLDSGRARNNVETGSSILGSISACAYSFASYKNSSVLKPMDDAHSSMSLYSHVNLLAIRFTYIASFQGFHAPECEHWSCTYIFAFQESLGTRLSLVHPLTSFSGQFLVSNLFTCTTLHPSSNVSKYSVCRIMVLTQPACTAIFLHTESDGINDICTWISPIPNWDNAAQ